MPSCHGRLPGFWTAPMTLTFFELYCLTTSVTCGLDEDLLLDELALDELFDLLGLEAARRRAGRGTGSRRSRPAARGTPSAGPSRRARRPRRRRPGPTMVLGVGAGRLGGPGWARPQATRSDCEDARGAVEARGTSFVAPGASRIRGVPASSAHMNQRTPRYASRRFQDMSYCWRWEQPRRSRRRRPGPPRCSGLPCIGRSRSGRRCP